jgi:hypothetical protein
VIIRSGNFVQDAWCIPADDINCILSCNGPCILARHFEKSNQSPRCTNHSGDSSQTTLSMFDRHKGDNPMTFWNTKGTHVIKNWFPFSKSDTPATFENSCITWLMAFHVIELKRKSTQGSDSNASSQPSSQSPSSPHRTLQRTSRKASLVNHTQLGFSRY